MHSTRILTNGETKTAHEEEVTGTSIPGRLASVGPRRGHSRTSIRTTDFGRPEKMFVACDIAKHIILARG